MTERDLARMALAAGYATSTLDQRERREAEALIASDPDFAAMVDSHRRRLAAEPPDVDPEKLWSRIESNLTHRGT